MLLPSRFLLSILPLALAAQALQRRGAASGPDVSLRSSLKATRDDRAPADISIVEPDQRFVAQLPCLGCPPISSAAEDEPTILLFHLALTADKKTLLVDDQPVYPQSDARESLPTLHARQWPATLARDIQLDMAKLDTHKESDNPFGSDYKTLAYRRTIFPIAGSTASVVQLDILGVGHTVSRSDEDPAAAKKPEDENTHAGTSLDSPEQKMIQLLIRRDPHTGALCISSVDLVARLGAGRATDADEATAISWTNRLLDTFSPPPDDPHAFARTGSKISTGGLTSYYQPPVLLHVPSSTAATSSPSLRTWLHTYWRDVVVLLGTVLFAVSVLYLVYLAGLYVRHLLAPDAPDRFGGFHHPDTDAFPADGWARMQRAKRFQAAAHARGSLERVLEEGGGAPADRAWDEKRRESWAGPGVLDSPNGAERRSLEGGQRGSPGKGRALHVRTGSANFNARTRRMTLPPTPVESWEAGSGWGWGWGER